MHNQNRTPDDHNALETATEPRETVPAVPGVPEPVVEATDSATRPWDITVSRLLEQAAIMCVEHGVDVDSFMNGAWSAYVESRPGMRAQLEEAQLREHLDGLRKLGRVASA